MTLKILSLVYSLGIGLLFNLANSSNARAVEPFVRPDGDFKWSQIIQHTSFGPTVYDRDYNKPQKRVCIEFVGDCDRSMEALSSWSKSGIRFTYASGNRSISGYEKVEHQRRIRDRPDWGHERKRSERKEAESYHWETYTVDEPIYSWNETHKSPPSIRFTIDQQVFVYESGPVSPELAKALANAPDRTMEIELVWQDGTTTQARIGKGTIRTWKTIFQP
jgi:hypothetical protein